MRLPTHLTKKIPALLLIGLLLLDLPLRGADDFTESLAPADSSAHGAASARLRMTPETLEQTDPRTCVSQAAEMANSENLDGFLDCFVTGSQKKLRKDTALLFARHDIEMDVLDVHVIKEGPTKSELAIRYRAKLSGSQYDVVSLVDVRKENGYWKISTEKVQEYEHQSPRSCHPSRYTCLGGTCRVAAR
jgi:hypothetical protein